MKTAYGPILLAAAIAWGGTQSPGDPGPNVRLINRSQQAQTLSTAGGPALFTFTADPSLAGGDLFHVMTSDPAVVVSLLTPGGTEINAGNADSLGYSYANLDGRQFVSSIPWPFLPQGTHTLIVLPPSSMPGSWQVKVDASAASAPVVAIVEYLSSSTIRAGLTAGAGHFQMGDTAILAGLVFDDVMPVTGAAATVAIGDPTDTLTPPAQVKLTDSGGGVYSGTFTPTKTVTFTAMMNVSGASASGISFARMVSTEFRVLPALAHIASISEAGGDDHLVGLIDRVSVTAGITVTTAGSYQLVVTLVSSGGSQIIRAATDNLSAGIGKLTATFSAGDLLELGVDGPYAISAQLFYLDDPQNPTVDFKANVGNTGPYSQQAIDRGSGNLLAVTPVTLDFGSVNVGASKNLTVTISNLGAVAFKATSASTGNSAFTVTSPVRPPHRVDRVARPASGPHAGRSPWSPAFGDTPPAPGEHILPGRGRRPCLVLLKLAARVAMGLGSPRCGSSAATGSTAPPPWAGCPASLATRQSHFWASDKNSVCTTYQQVQLALRRVRKIPFSLRALTNRPPNQSKGARVTSGEQMWVSFGKRRSGGVRDAGVLVADVLDKQQDQDVILVLGRVHAAAQLITRLPQRGVQLRFLDDHYDDLGACERCAMGCSTPGSATHLRHEMP
jgi:hypothetical protein